MSIIKILVSSSTQLFSIAILNKSGLGYILQWALSNGTLVLLQSKHILFSLNRFLNISCTIFGAVPWLILVNISSIEPEILAYDLKIVYYVA